MTTAPIKTTDELAKESESRGVEPIAPIPTTTQADASAAIPPAAEDSDVAADTDTAKPAAAQDKSDSKSETAVKSAPSKPKPPLEPVTEQELADFASSLDKLSFKNTTKLVAFKTTCNKFKKRIKAEELQFIELINTTETRLTALLEKNKTHQEKLHETTITLLETLKKSLADGKSAEALSAWDKIQGNISNTLGKSRGELQKLATEYKDAINELREWKIFASTEKKKQLIEQIKHLGESKMHASDRSKHIATMHKEWKSLGRSNQNEELWAEFKVLSDKAYEPCKEYFKQRKQLMVENLKSRREICAQLEKDVAQLEGEDLNISQVNKLLSSAEAQWKKYAPVEQSKINTLQKQFYALINQLRKLRRNSVKGNAKAKQEYIDAALALGALEDNNSAMSQAKSLQQQWKKVGPTSFKEDKKYWEEFRAACDKIFEQRNNESEMLKEDLAKVESSLNAILNSLSAFLELEDEEFRNCRAEYQEAMQKFSSELDPRLKSQRTQLLDQFNAIKRKMDMRFKSLPDKKLLLLLAQLSEKTALIEAVENSITSAGTDDAIALLPNDEKKAEWQSHALIGREELDTLLNQRWQALSKVKTNTEFKKLVLNGSNEMRDLCIDLEIRANIESPALDQASRMTIQLAQLKNSFGKAKPERADNTKFAKAMELKLRCIGPVDPDSRADYLVRASAAIDRLK
ncbi:MAG: exonuclease SbcC [Pseudohongiellaceae bacterium]|jgi:exonuclease SbcC